MVNWRPLKLSFSWKIFCLRNVDNLMACWNACSRSFLARLLCLIWSMINTCCKCRHNPSQTNGWLGVSRRTLCTDNSNCQSTWKNLQVGRPSVYIWIFQWFILTCYCRVWGSCIQLHNGCMNKCHYHMHCKFSCRFPWTIHSGCMPSCKIWMFWGLVFKC